MISSKLVSIIMTVYNQKNYISEAIESILNQTYRNIELIIINDGSTDGTDEIIEKYRKADNRIIAVHRKNMGRVQSLNDAIDISSGEYLAVMDADDISELERIEKQVIYLDEHNDIYLLGTNFKMFYMDGVSDEVIAAKERYKKIGNSVIDKNDVFSSINDSMKVLHPTWMLRKEAFDIVGKYNDYICEDGEYLFRVAAAGLGIDKIYEELLRYRISPETRSSGKNKEDKLKDGQIEFKVKYLMEDKKIVPGNIKYMIWGSDYSGKSGYEYLSKVMPESRMIGYIDSFMEGQVEGFPVIKPDKINDYKPDYIFICTNGGGEYARKYLSKMGLEQVKDYFKIV